LLLVVIAVAAISVTYAWIMVYMNNTTDQAGVNLFKANVRFISGSTEKIAIDIGNSGTSDAQILAVYFGTSSSTMTSQTTSPALPQTIAAGTIGKTLTITRNWSPNTEYYFKVVSDAGGQPLEFQETAP
jgi:hypothetical protein